LHCITAQKFNQQEIYVLALMMNSFIPHSIHRRAVSEYRPPYLQNIDGHLLLQKMKSSFQNQILQDNGGFPLYQEFVSTLSPQNSEISPNMPRCFCFILKSRNPLVLEGAKYEKNKNYYRL